MFEQITVGFAIVIVSYFKLIVAQVVALAFGSAAASFFPEIILRVDERANREEVSRA